jgi:hypothetical protein
MTPSFFFRLFRFLIPTYVGNGKHETSRETNRKRNTKHHCKHWLKLIFRALLFPKYHETSPKTLFFHVDTTRLVAQEARCFFLLTWTRLGAEAGLPVGVVLPARQRYTVRNRTRRGRARRETLDTST